MSSRLTSSTVLLASALAVAPALPASAQQAPSFAIDLRGGLNVPTFDITDAAESGPSLGLGLSARVAPRWHLMADVDAGFHPGAEIGAQAGPDVDVWHFVGKVGYEVTEPGAPLSVVLNAGAGAMRFDVDGVADFTYPAINVGAKIVYALAPGVSLLLSPQGDIAFSDESELGTTNSWVWPFTAGIRFGL